MPDRHGSGQVPARAVRAVTLWKTGAAGGNRTPDIQLGKLTFYL
jgi:hypothetical protein